MTYRKPTHAYWSLLFPAIPFGVNWMFETFIKTQKWWGELPLFWLTWIFVAVGAGLLLGDCYNGKSWLRHNLREFFKVFEVRACFIAQELEPHQFFSIVCLLKFTKDIKQGDLTVKVIQVLPSGNRIHVVHSEKITTIKDSERRLRLGSMPIPQPGDFSGKHAIWGEALGDENLLPSQTPLIPDLAIIEVSLNRQKHRAYVNKQPIFLTDVHSPITLMNAADIEALNAS